MITVREGKCLYINRVYLQQDNNQTFLNMRNLIVVVFAFLVTFLLVVDGNSCRKFIDRMFQVKIQLAGLRPFYSLLALERGRVFTDTMNIADGNNEAELGTNLTFNVHQGFYSCSANRMVKLTSIGYIYRKANDPNLENDGALAVHQFILRFPNAMNFDDCKGTFRFGIFPIDSDPFDGNTQPFSESPVVNVTCISLNGRNFNWPS